MPSPDWLLQSEKASYTKQEIPLIFITFYLFLKKVIAFNLRTLWNHLSKVRFDKSDSAKIENTSKKIKR